MNKFDQRIQHIPKCEVDDRAADIFYLIMCCSGCFSTHFKLLKILPSYNVYIPMQKM